MIEVIVLVIGIIFIIFGTGELITAIKIRKISKDILKQNDKLWELIRETGCKMITEEQIERLIEILKRLHEDLYIISVKLVEKH